MPPTPWIEAPCIKPFSMSCANLAIRHNMPTGFICEESPMNAIPGRSTGVISRWLVYLAALLVALAATALLLNAAEYESPRAITPSSHTSSMAETPA